MALADDDLALAYDALAAAIDRAGTQHELAFLSRLALLLLADAPDLARAQAAIAAAEAPPDNGLE